MMENSLFTQEANAMLEHYIKSYGESLRRSHLSDEEIHDVLMEVREHIIENCKIKAGDGNIVTTDLVRSAIKKFGEPELVEQVLKEEFEVMNQAKGKPMNATELTINAEQTIMIYRTMSMLSTIFGISFVVLDLINYESFFFYQVHVLFFMFSTVWYLIIRTRPVFEHNAYLERFLRLDHHQLLIPQIMLIYALFNDSPNFSIFTSLFLSISLLLSNQAKHFYLDIFDALRKKITFSR